MRIDNFMCFRAVKHFMSFTEAADSLFISQSALSKQIMALENELEVTLLDRHHSTIRLTPAGEQISIHIEAILNEYERMRFSARCFQDSQNSEQKLRLASFYEMAQYGITDLIVTFEQNEPGFHMESTECGHSHMFDMLGTNSIDFAIGYREFFPTLFIYQYFLLRNDPIVLIVNHRHPLAEHDSIRLEEARSERFCFPKEDTLLFKFFKDSCVAAGFVPNLTQSDVRLSTIRDYIRVGMRVTLQPEIRALKTFVGPEFKIIPLLDAPVLTLAIVTNSVKLSDIGKRFLDFARKYEFSQMTEAVEDHNNNV